MSKFPIEPQNNLLVVSPFKRKEEKLKSLFIPSTANAELSVGEVLAASVDSGHEVGQIVTYPTGSGTGQLVNGNPCLWIRANEIWAVWDKEAWEKLNQDNE